MKDENVGIVPRFSRLKFQNPHLQLNCVTIQQIRLTSVKDCKRINCIYKHVEMPVHIISTLITQSRCTSVVCCTYRLKITS